MSVNRRGSRCWQLCLYVYTFFYWASGLFLIFLGIWMLIDPKRSYVLQLVHFSEDDPLLIFAAGMSIIVGAISCIVGFLAFCGANKRIRCVLGTFIVCAAVICISEIGIGTLALVFRNKFSNDRAPVYLSNLTHNHYSRDYWVRPLIDTIQFYLLRPSLKTELARMMRSDYGVSLENERNRRLTALIDRLQYHEQCCGATGDEDWLRSVWHGKQPIDSELAHVMRHDSLSSISHHWRPVVPLSCCSQVPGATVQSPVASSLARCQMDGGRRPWRFTRLECCGGGNAARDYENSFWFVTNGERGTRSFVPQSCCKQAQAGRAWAIQPVDPLCSIYHYNTQAFRSAVNDVGCHDRLVKWLDEQTWIFAGVGFGFALFQMIGIIVSLLYCNSIHYYTLVV